MSKRAKFRKHKAKPRLLDFDKRTVKSSQLHTTKVATRVFPLSTTGRISYVYRLDKTATVVEVISVSYQISSRNQWLTVIYYDSTHGNLHRHITASIQNPQTSVSTTGIDQEKTPHQWLTWAIDDIKDKHLQYRADFLERSNPIGV